MAFSELADMSPLPYILTSSKSMDTNFDRPNVLFSRGNFVKRGNESQYLSKRSRRLTSDERKEIEKRLNSGEMSSRLASEFGVGRSTISTIGTQMRKNEKIVSLSRVLQSLTSDQRIPIIERFNAGELPTQTTAEFESFSLPECMTESNEPKKGMKENTAPHIEPIAKCNEYSRQNRRGRSKLTMEHRNTIIERLIAGELGSRLATEFKVHPTTISRLKLKMLDSQAMRKKKGSEKKSDELQTMRIGNMSRQIRRKNRTLSTDEQAAIMRDLMAGEVVKNLAAKFGVSLGKISRIRTRLRINTSLGKDIQNDVESSNDMPTTSGKAHDAGDCSQQCQEHEQSMNWEKAFEGLKKYQEWYRTRGKKDYSSNHNRDKISNESSLIKV